MASVALTPTASVMEIFQSRQGEGVCVGDAQMFVRFGGCNVVCDYCDTPDSIPSKAGTRVTLPDVLERIGTPDPKKGLNTVSLTGGEPLVHVGFLQALIPELRRRGWQIYLETNGTLPGALEKIAEGCDWIAMDFKPASAIGRDQWEAHQWFLKIGGSKIFVKMVLTATTTEVELRQAVALLKAAPHTIPLVLQPATPWSNVASIPMDRLVSWWQEAGRCLKDVRILPQIHRLWDIP